MTSKLTRERLAEIAQFGFSSAITPANDFEIKELSRMALAAMDSEPVELPIDYLQGHKDGLEWAAQLAEANHPETGDWLYDDPIELAKAIRKGPDMPPAQPAPVVPDEIKHRIGGLDWGWEGEFNRGWNACRAAMLQAEPVCTCPSGDGSLRWPCPVHPGNSPAIPDCWCRTCRPVTLNDMRFVVCPDCGNKRCPRANDHRNACTRSNEPGQEGSAYPAAPQEVKGE